MKLRIAIAVAVCDASASLAFASPRRITDFADGSFSVADIVSDALLDDAHPKSPANRRVQLAVAG